MGSDAITTEGLLKTAAEWKPSKGGMPLAVALGAALLMNHMAKSVKNDETAAQGRIDMKRLAEARNNFGDLNNLRGGEPLSYPGAATYNAVMADSNTPNFESMDKSSAEELMRDVGRALAKTAGIGGMLGSIGKAITPGLGTKVLLGAGAVGAGMLGMKAGKKALEFGNQPAPERQQGAPGPGLPRYVNEYGQAAL
jgi:hypothetical protein